MTLLRMMTYLEGWYYVPPHSATPLQEKMTARKDKRRVEVLFILLVTELCIQCENDVKSWNGKSDLLIEINYMILHNFLHLFHKMQL